MERLTEYDNVWKEWKITNPVENSQYVPAKLAEFEDFMERNKYNSLLDLQADLASLSVTKLSLKLSEENEKTLINRLNKLEKYIREFPNNVCGKQRPKIVNEYIVATCEDILYKMRELEKVVEEENG